MMRFKVKRKAVNYGDCYILAMWNRTDRECLNCDMWEMCATKQSNEK